MKACRKSKALLPAFIYGELNDRESSQLQAHLDSCENCRREYEGLQQLTHIMNRRQRPVLSEEYWQQYDARLKEKLWAPATPERQAGKSLKPAPHRGIRFSWTLLPAAAAVLLVVGLSLQLFLSREGREIMRSAVDFVQQINPAVAEHFDNLKPLLIDYSTPMPQDTPVAATEAEPVEVDKKIIEKLLIENQLLKQVVARQNNVTVQQIMDDLELVLMELRSNENPEEIRRAVLRLIRDNDILFKIQVLEKKKNDAVKI